MRLRSALLAAVLLFALDARATSWFVAPNGDDRGRGTSEQPFATIARAAAEAKPGDVVNVRAGVYKGVVRIDDSGTRERPIVIRAVPGDNVVIDGAGTPPDTHLVQLLGTAWVQFIGFEVRNATGFGIVAYGTRQTTIAYNKVHDCLRSGIWAGMEHAGVSTDLTIKGNTVHDTALQNAAHTAEHGWPQAVAVHKTTRATISGNWIYRNQGEGVAVILSDHVAVRDNQVWDNYSVGIYLDNAQWATVERNFVRSSGDRKYYRGGHPSFGIAAANERYDTSNPLDHLTIANNTIVRSRSAIYYGNFERGGGLRNTHVSRNTCYLATEALLRIENAPHHAAVVEHNVFVQPGNAPLANVAGSGVTYRANRWNRPDRGNAAGRGDVVGEVPFVNPGGSTAADYRLK